MYFLDEVWMSSSINFFHEDVIFEVVAIDEKDALDKIFEQILDKKKCRIDPRLVIWFFFFNLYYKINIYVIVYKIF